MIRIFTAALTAALATTATGCSTVGGLFGLSPPQFKLTPETVALRDAQSGSPAPIPKELNKALLPDYVVEPGDTLLIQPVDLDSPVRLPGDQVILPDGTIDLGPFGSPIVAGKTLAQIEADVHGLVIAGLRTAEKELAKERGPDAPKPPTDAELLRSTRVNVRLVGRASKVYYVLGEVNAPGVFPLSGRETVLDGIIAAGNLTRKASSRNIVLARPTTVDGCRMVLPVCIDEIMQQADPSTNYQLQPGDRIYVASKGLLEDFQNKRKPSCGPCGWPKTPCPLGTGCGASPACGAAAPAVGLPALGLPAAPGGEPLSVPESVDPAVPNLMPDKATAPIPTPATGPKSPIKLPALELPPLPKDSTVPAIPKAQPSGDSAAFVLPPMMPPH